MLARGVEVALVVAKDNPRGHLVESVTACRQHGGGRLPDNLPTPELLAQVAALAPDFIFSFYYRHMLPVNLLALARHGAFNMHGSLLPKYRGRVPINWAVLHGESETGATLHEMAAKPDAGYIVAQTSVPILPDDTAYEVFGKVVVAAEQTLWNALPAMLTGKTPKLPNNLAQGSYFGGRKPADGEIDWSQPARGSTCTAVAPLSRRGLPGRSFVESKFSSKLAADALVNLPQGLAVVDNRIVGVCGDGRALLINELLADGQTVTPEVLNNILL